MVNICMSDMIRYVRRVCNRKYFSLCDLKHEQYFEFSMLTVMVVAVFWCYLRFFSSRSLMIGVVIS